MFVLILIPLAWGHLLASRLLREPQRGLRLGLGYALGLLSFLMGVNGLFHVLSLRWAVYFTVALLALGSALLLRLPSRLPDRTALGPVAGPILAGLALTAFFEALFWQMQWSDDDFFLHGPLMALTLRDVFPTENPFFPNLPLIGHYGRDLTISALSVLAGERFLAVQYVITALNQAAAVLVLHGTARRFLRSPSQALWVTLFAFAGVNFGSRRGLLETFQNNNSFAFLFLFVSLYLFLAALTRRSPAVVVLSGVALGTYALVYETSFGLLALAFAAFPVALCALRRRWRLRYFVVTTGILLLSLALALVQGGVVTELAKPRRAGGTGDVAKSMDERRMSKELIIRIPKPGFRITAPFTAMEYPLWSWHLEKDAGTFIAVLPLSALLMLWRRRPWGILIAGLSVIAILIPAAVDFGGVNSESLRFLLVGGVGAAMLFGVVLGMAWDAARHRPQWLRSCLAVALAGIAVVCFWPSVRVAFDIVRAAARYPRDHYLVAEEWGCTTVLPRRPCEPIDVAAAVALRPMIRAGERVLADLEGADATTAILAEATFMTFARAFVAGPGIRVLREGTYSQMTPFWEGAGFRARAFLGTGEVTILDDLGVTYLYLNPDLLAPEVYDRIQHDSRLQRLLHLEAPGGGAVREAYRVMPATTFPSWLSPEPFRLVSAAPPTQLGARHVYPMSLLLAAPSAQPGGTLRLSYDLRFPDGRLVTVNDEVRLPVALRPAGPARWTASLWLATPYEPGLYDLHLYAWDGPRRLPLPHTDGRPAVLRIRVE